MNRSNPILSVIGGGLYGFSAAIFSSYYNWQYAQEHGFIAWLFFGEVIATLQGILWPFFIF